ncbi:T9SS sorting signal type C domain-containing protein [Xanthomarina sp. F2636L]|uniref:T9SS sorting signal type C domain-containing protein n=1 Tax=Xanthomarina sp. F2636L TaxID=2996018 RepID=UPI00225E5555|nr:T9SS sorting signal type C domain-containing protein [Xanthomarina sp. F2636L]MCX7551136.1 T9SS sorting signal type C domain-containing protein [Xanthomarina sp. F2636L]
MKYTLLLATLLVTFLSFSQDKWPNMMFDRDANFYDIQQDFEKYYNEKTGASNKISRGTGIKQYKRWEYYWESRVDENGNFPSEGHVLKEMMRYNTLQTNALNRGYTTNTGNWELVGPIAVPDNGTGQLNGNGRVNCIAFHPTDPNTIFVGAPSGGFWKSTDNGSTWTEYSNGLVRLGVSSIVIHPTNHDILYLGTGDRDAADAPGYGVYKSVDGGLTWASSNAGMGNRTVYEILMDPTNSDVLIASTNGNRIYKSTDAGLSWSYASTSSAMKDIAFKPGDSNTIYASGTTVDVSTNGGNSFTQVTNGVPNGGVYRIALAVSADQPDWVYLVAGDGGGLEGIYRSEDSGVSFSTRTTTPNVLGYETNGSDSNSQAWYDLVIAADPTNANIIYTGGINIWKSIDGGATMNINTYWVGSTGTIDGVHADQHAFEFSPFTNDVYSGNDGGVYYSADNGANWNDISSGLAIAQIYKIGVSQMSENLVINGYQDNGTAINRNAVFTTEIGGDGMECIIDPTDDSYMYGALYYGDIRRSTNGGFSFSTIADNGTNGINETGAWVTPYTLDPNTPARMFAGYDNVWRSDDVKTPGSNSIVWTRISNFGGTSNMVDLAVAPSNSNVMYVSRSGSGRFYYSNNALSASPTWTNLTSSLPTSSSPKDIEIDPTDETHLFIALGNDIYESTDAGSSWTNVSGTLPNISLNTIVIDASSPIEAMYVGMDVGVYYKDNTLADWEPFDTGLANLEITELEIHSNTSDCNSKLFAATYGQGLWMSDLKDPGNVAPTACFKADTTQGCVNSSFMLTDNSDYTPTSWAWTITPGTFTYTNGTTANSQNPEVIFTDPGTYTVALTATNANGSNTNTKVDYINIVSGSAASDFNTDFEAEALCGTASDCGATSCNLVSAFWTNLTNGSEDNIDWRVDEGGTSSSNTGPNTDYNPGTASGNYIYLESSSCYQQIAILESSCMVMDAVNTYDLKFAYHMFGTDMGSLHLDILFNGIWQENMIPAISGDQGNAWQTATVDLSAYLGETIKLRFRGVTGPGYTSDMALDDIQLVSNTISTSEFESASNDITINGTEYLEIASSKEQIKQVMVYDILGRQLFNDPNINTQTFEIKAIKKSHTILLLKITLNNNHVEYRKILF